MSADDIPPVSNYSGTSYPAYTSSPAATGDRPGRTLGIVGFVLSFFWVLDIIGLIISIVAMTQAKRAGHANGLALAGIIVSIGGILVWGGIAGLTMPTLVHAGQECARLGNGTHVVGNSTYTCTPTSFNVSTGQ